MIPISTTVEHDLDLAITVLVPTGDLTSLAVPDIRGLLATCFAECPDAVIVDLGALRAAADVDLGLFRQAENVQRLRRPAVPLVLCAAPEAIADRLAGPLCDTLADGVASVTHPMRRMHRRLAPERGAPRTARELVAAACGAWGLTTLVTPAELVVSELVSNAVLHAGTDVDVTVTVRPPYLHLAVRDRSDRLPRPVEEPPPDVSALPERGRGLPLIETLATTWGTVEGTGGKTVWALLAGGVDGPRPTRIGP